MPQPPRGRTDRLDKVMPDHFPIKSGSSFAGKVTLSSGSATVDVAYGAFTSSDIFLSLVPVLSTIAAIASRTHALGITSMVPGTGFTVGWTGGLAYPADVVIHWVVGKTA